MTKYGRSPWLEGFPRSRVPIYPRQKDSFDTDVVIVGGGLTGCATAYAFAAAGVKVSLLESGQIGRGSTCWSPGWIADEPGTSFTALSSACGLRAARQVFQAWHRAALDFAALIRRLDVKCRLDAAGALLIAASPDQMARLRREQKARRAAGLDAPLLPGRVVSSEAGLPAGAAIRARDGGLLDPYRAAIGLAAAAEERGARLFERSPAGLIKFTRRGVEVKTADGMVRAGRVVVATGTPTPLFKPLARHFWFRDSFAALTEPVPGRIRRLLGQRTSVVRDSSAPPHFVRWVDDERLLVAGADSEAVPPRNLEKRIVQRTGQLMYELSTMYPEMSGLMPEYGWSVPYAATPDGLPFVGPHRNFPHHLFAFGGAAHSVTGAYLASRILLRYHLEELDGGDEIFSFARDLRH